MRNTVFTKDMTVEEIEKAADKQWAKLHDVYIYLNEAGKAAETTFHEISWECTFSETKEDLINNIDESIKNGRIKDARVIKNLNHFKKNYLQ